MAESYTKRQKLIGIIIGTVNFFSAICVSLQSPFYPDKAEEKGATSTQYGLVFGVFELTVFIVCPIIGKFLVKLGIHRCFVWGIAITGFCCIIFGILDFIQDPRLFVIAGIFIRIFEALGNSAFITASFSIIAQEFSSNVATMFSTIEMCFGFGLIVGPTIGAYLYEVGGFLLPFVVLGTTLLISSLIAQISMPSMDFSTNSNKKKGVVEALSLIPIFLACACVFSASLSLGFLQVNLEPHLRNGFDVSTITVGLIFMLNGATYAFTAPLFGWICDKKINPKFIGLLGNFLITISVAVMGPIPYLGIPKDYTLIVVALGVHGVGLGCSLVSGFSDAHEEAIGNGFENNIHTYGLVSGIWASAFALGAFVGPTLGGYLKDQIGFEWSSILVVIFSILSFIATTIFLIVSSFKSQVVHIQLDDEKSLMDESCLNKNNNNNSNVSYGTLEECS
ncbi:MFS-type transporter SLC18B1 [Lepeophtheirus salmonis]|uniref:Major facilitator superfamily (MFS) profile domain-containing protein n=1 Tax=Lepeophtheirus salmonis TaxID=72036 RepID=A0A0K2TD73_LEPSM|nr:MFS-type transporter SLC18B1-like [Lepeophtheirus salmonis]XP_040575635.1 MFS-type transporter SLC18B1-like [Lepeophtheirus salmonis]XP_040575636.1 MFS-type transporter SLC18B1-like [Lepeophtheirus salmonis]